MHVQIFRYRDLLRLVDNIGDFLFVDNIGDFLSVDNIGDGGSWLIWQMAVCLIIGNCSAASTADAKCNSKSTTSPAKYRDANQNPHHLQGQQAPLMPKEIQNPPHHLQCPSQGQKSKCKHRCHNQFKIHTAPAQNPHSTCRDRGKSHKSNSVQSASITAKNNSKSTLHLQG